jgi:hypothetical protein
VSRSSMARWERRSNRDRLWDSSQSSGLIRLRRPAASGGIDPLSQYSTCEKKQLRWQPACSCSLEVNKGVRYARHIWRAHVESLFGARDQASDSSAAYVRAGRDLSGRFGRRRSDRSEPRRTPHLPQAPICTAKISVCIPPGVVPFCASCDSWTRRNGRSTLYIE